MTHWQLAVLVGLSVLIYAVLADSKTRRDTALALWVLFIVGCLVIEAKYGVKS